MPRRDPIRSVMTLIFAAIATAGGCSSPPSRPGDHAPASILDSGPQPKITSQQTADIQFTLGRSFEDESKFDQAQAAYVAALQKDPKRGDAEHRLAILDDRKGNREGADKHFARALKLRPTDPEILCDRGYSLYLRRRWSDAEADLKKALTLDPVHPRSHANLALVMARRGDGEAALAEFARAGCDPSDARSNLGLIYAMEGHFEESKKEYALALQAKPKSALAGEGLRAATVASGGLETPLSDPALVRTSADPGH
jgi:Flp pilus assembly protein TadD